MGTKHDEVVLDNCSKLNVDRFDKISTTGDVFWLLERYKGDIIETSIDLKEVWQNVLDEFSEVIGNDSGKIIANKQIRLTEMIAKSYRVANGLKHYYSNAMKDEFKDSLSALLKSDGFDPETNKEDKLLLKLKSLKNKIKWSKSDLKSMIPEATQGKKIDVIEQLLSLERVLDLKYQLDSESLSVKKYAFLIKAANKKAEKDGK